jgi:2-dehydro-3-deoxygluconokinase
MPEVITLGETMVLLDPATPGPLRYVHEFTKRMGGAETNFAIGVVRLGHSAGWISRLGDDEFGRFILQTVRGEGVDTSQVRIDPHAPTGLFFKERLGEATGVYYYRAGSAASRLAPEDIDEAYVRSGRWLHVTGITPALSRTARDAVLRAVAVARAAGLEVSFDPNMRLKLWSREQAQPVFRALAAQCTVLLPGLDEAEIMLDEPPGTLLDHVATEAGLWEVCARLHALGPRIVALKLGEAGAAASDGTQIVRARPHQVRVVDPIGAGDAFAAGLVTGLLEGLSLRQALERANAMGAFALTVPGDWEALPSRAQLEAFLAGAGRVLR